MAQFLRDIHLTNVKITEETLTQLFEVFTNRAALLHEAALQSSREEKKPFLTFIIRFDEKGYRLFTIEELLRHFRRAKNIERIIFTVETGESLRANRMVGDHLELRMDKADEKNCYFSVTSDDSDWVDASYSAVLETLNKYKTKNGWVRSGWSTLIVQIAGVIVGFALSLWAA